VISSPRHSAWTVSTALSTAALRSANRSGASTKSPWCQPGANEIPTRPPDRLSTTAHSSAIRTGSCSGATTLPARRCTFSVMVDSAAAATDGFG
jgi:hypothetical protein